MSAVRKIKPTSLLLVYLVILYSLAVFLNADAAGIYRELVRLAGLTFGMLSSYWLLQLWRGQPVKWMNLLITLLIVAILADNQLTLGLAVLLGLVTMFFKLFVRLQRQPLFNPAAIAIAVLGPLGVTATWWGASFGPRLTDLGISVAMLLTLPFGLYLTWKFKELPTILSTIPVFLTTSWILTGGWPWQLVLEGTFAFFLLIMATEPKTTPLQDPQEWVFGLLLGSGLAAAMATGWAQPYIWTLLILNAAFGGWQFFKKSQTKTAHVMPHSKK